MFEVEQIFIRGAITADKNEKNEILKKTRTLLEEIIRENSIVKEDILSILFTATRDLDAVYPAVAAREIGLTEAALMCVQEMYVQGSLEKCIRVMVTAASNKKQCEAVHVYREKAEILRPDLKRN